MPAIIRGCIRSGSPPFSGPSRRFHPQFRVRKGSGRRERESAALYESTCWPLLEGAAAGEGAARSQFVARYERLVRAFLGSYLGSGNLRDEIDDLTQEVFYECFRGGGVLERSVDTPPGNFRAYLRGVSLNLARQWVERRRRHRERFTTSESLESRLATEQTASRMFDRLWAEEVVSDAACLMERRALKKSFAARRRVELLKLRFQSGWPIREIAHRWELPARRVHKDYATAREEFRKALGDVVSSYCRGTAEEIQQECRQVLDDLQSS